MMTNALSNAWQENETLCVEKKSINWHFLFLSEAVWFTALFRRQLCNLSEGHVIWYGKMNCLSVMEWIHESFLQLQSFHWVPPPDFFLFWWHLGRSWMFWGRWHIWCQVKQQPTCHWTQLPIAPWCPLALINCCRLCQWTHSIWLQHGNVGEQTRFVITSACGFIGGNAWRVLESSECLAVNDLGTASTVNSISIVQRG